MNPDEVWGGECDRSWSHSDEIDTVCMTLFKTVADGGRDEAVVGQLCAAMDAGSLCWGRCVDFVSSRHKGKALLHQLASKTGCGAALSCLLERYKAGTAVRANDGNTPLHTAAYHGHVAALHILLQAGAQPGVSNRYGETALQTAQNARQQRCAEVIGAWAAATGAAPGGGADPPGEDDQQNGDQEQEQTQTQEAWPRAEAEEAAAVAAAVAPKVYLAVARTQAKRLEVSDQHALQREASHLCGVCACVFLAQVVELTSSLRCMQVGTEIRPTAGSAGLVAVGRSKVRHHSRWIVASSQGEWAVANIAHDAATRLARRSSWPCETRWSRHTMRCSVCRTGRARRVLARYGFVTLARTMAPSSIVRLCCCRCRRCC